MKKEILLYLIILYSLPGYAQKLPDFKPLRYDENYSFLRKDTTDSWYKKMKYSPIKQSKGSYLSFGGDIRYQYFNIKNEGWGEDPRDKDGYILTRYLLHMDFHAGKYFRTFLQLQSSFANGKQEPGAVDDNPLDLHQAFVDFSVFARREHNLVFRFGRQELSYGSQRLVSVREGPNNRQSFDGLKAMFASGKYKADLFYTYYTGTKKKIFDEGLDKNVRFWGAYIVRNKVAVLQNIDLYYLGLQKKETGFDDGRQKELRHSFGTRIWNNNKDWKYDLEGVYQSGSFGESKISAWTTSANVSYTFSSLKHEPLAGLKSELVSGDKHYNDGHLNTFNPLFPRGAYFGLAALIAPVNLFDIHPYLEYSLTEKLSLHSDYDIFWRMSYNDGIYTPSVRLVYSGKGTSSKYIGQQIETSLIYTPNPFLYLRGELTWFNAGKYLEQAGSGKNILLAGLTVQCKL